MKLYMDVILVLVLLNSGVPGVLGNVWDFVSQAVEAAKYNIAHPSEEYRLNQTTDEDDDFKDFPEPLMELHQYQDRVAGKVHQTINLTVYLSMENNQDILSQKTILWNTTSSFLNPISGNLSLESKNNFTGDVSLTSSLIGIYYIKFYTSDHRPLPIKNAKNINEKEAEYKLEIAVERQDENINKIVNLFFAVALTIALFFMGMDIDLSIILETVKRPIGPFLGMICQFGVMPGLAYLFGKIFLETNYEQLGLLLLGCSPGGAFSNVMTLLFGGDLNLSVTMTFFSTVASFAMTTVWIYFLGSPLVGKHITIPYLNLGISLASFTLPALLGVWFKHKKPMAAEKVKAWVSKPFFLTVLVITPVAVAATNWFFFYLCSWRHIVSGTLLALCGYLFGAILAAIFCQKRAQIIAISMETAIQNVGIPLISLNLTFQSPYSDMGILPIISYFFFSTGPIMFIVYGIYILSQKLCGNKEAAKKNKYKNVDEVNPGDDLLLTNDVDGDKAVQELLLGDQMDGTDTIEGTLLINGNHPINDKDQMNGNHTLKGTGPVDGTEVAITISKSSTTINEDQIDKETSTNNNGDSQIIFIPITPDAEEGEIQIPSMMTKSPSGVPSIRI